MFQMNDKKIKLGMLLSFIDKYQFMNWLCSQKFKWLWQQQQTSRMEGNRSSSLIAGKDLQKFIVQCLY